MSFQITYKNARGPVPQPDRSEEYGLESAFYDYDPDGMSADLIVGDYVLPLAGVRFIDLVREALPLAESLMTRPDDETEIYRPDLPALPNGSKVYSLVFADFLHWFPVVIFVVRGDDVWIYTRTQNEEPGPAHVVLASRDRREPVRADLRAVIREIHAFLSCYLRDLSSAFPFVSGLDSYQQWQGRLGALKGFVSSAGAAEE